MRIPSRLMGNDGQGLLEVLVVVGLFGGLLAVGLPAYMGFQDRKADESARAHLEAATPAAQVYRMRRGTYARLNSVVLRQIDPRISPTVTVTSARRGSYCLTETVQAQTWSLRGPRGATTTFKQNDSCS